MKKIIVNNEEIEIKNFKVQRQGAKRIILYSEQEKERIRKNKHFWIISFQANRNIDNDYAGEKVEEYLSSLLNKEKE